MYVIKFEDLTKDDIGIAGGKGANLGELTQANIPVPPGFVVTAETYDKFMQDTGIFNKVMDIIDEIDINNTKELQEAAEEIKEIIIATPMPDDISTMILEAYNQLSMKVGEDEADVAVRKVLIAVVVQQMVDSDKAGVMFTVNPSTGENIALIEGSWGLGESVVSGTVTPDNYAVDKDTNKILNVTISDKKTWFVNDENGTSVQKDVPEDMRNERVLSDEELIELTEMGKRVQAHYGKPQDTEWAFHAGNLFLLQSRPITTLDENAGEAASGDDDVELEVIIRGLGASPGYGSCHEKS